MSTWMANEFGRQWWVERAPTRTADTNIKRLQIKPIVVINSYSNYRCLSLSVSSPVCVSEIFESCGCFERRHTWSWIFFIVINIVQKTINRRNNAISRRSTEFCLFDVVNFASSADEEFAEVWEVFEKLWRRLLEWEEPQVRFQENHLKNAKPFAPHLEIIKKFFCWTFLSWKSRKLNFERKLFVCGFTLKPTNRQKI